MYYLQRIRFYDILFRTKFIRYGLYIILSKFFKKYDYCQNDELLRHLLQARKLSNNMLPKKSNGIELRKLLSHFCRHTIEEGMVMATLKRL